MRVVLDTNVLVSAFLWQKELKPIYDAIRGRRVTPVMSSVTFDELKRVLAYPQFQHQILSIGITADEMTSLLSKRASFVPATPFVDIMTDDPSDNHILACAQAGRVECIVSGDKRLLKLISFQGIPIIAPRPFLTRLENV